MLIRGGSVVVFSPEGEVLIGLPIFRPNSVVAIDIFSSQRSFVDDSLKESLHGAHFVANNASLSTFEVSLYSMLRRQKSKS